MRQGAIQTQQTGVAGSMWGNMNRRASQQSTRGIAIVREDDDDGEDKGSAAEEKTK